MTPKVALFVILLALPACAAVGPGRLPPTGSDTLVSPAMSGDYGVYSFAIRWLVHGNTHELIDTVRVLDSTETQLGELGKASAPPGFGEAMESLRARAQHPERLVAAFGVPWPVQVLPRASAWAQAAGPETFGFSRPGYSADSTRAVLFIERVHAADVCPGPFLLFLTRKPGRSWVESGVNILSCE